MSRSYKHNPYNTDGSMRKFGKKFANDKVRNSDFDEIGSRGSYKKAYEQYDIADWVYRWTWEEALEHYRQNPDKYKKYPTEKDFYRYWYKLMRAK